MTLVRRRVIAFGDAGSLTTLHAMQQLIDNSLSVPLVIETAHGIVSGVRSRDYTRMAQAIRQWLVTHFKFIPDPVGQELLRDPDYQLRQYQTQGYVTGDCDDAAILGCALGKAVGLGCKLVAIGFTPGGPLTHVFGVLIGRGEGVINPGAQGIDLDVTRPGGARAVPVRRVEVMA